VVRNDYLRKGLANLCDYTNMSLVCPPPYLCVDNGIMIAWYVLTLKKYCSVTYHRLFCGHDNFKRDDGSEDGNVRGYFHLLSS